MANGIGITEGSGKTLATIEKLFSGVLQHQQFVGIVSGDANAYAATVDVNGNLQVNVSGLKNGVKAFSISVPVSGAATAIFSTPLATRTTVLLCNESDTTIRVGPSTAVTTAGTNLGYPIYSGQTLSLDLSANVNLYAVHAGAAAKQLTVMEIG